MPIQNIEEVGASYPFVDQIKEAIPCSDFEIISVDGAEKLKLYLDFSDFESTYRLSKNYGEDFARLPEDIRGFLNQIEIADVRCRLHNQYGIESSFQKISTLLPEVKDLGIVNSAAEPVVFPMRYFDKFSNLPSLQNLRYPEGVIDTLGSSRIAIERTMDDLRAIGLNLTLNFNEEDRSETLKLERLTAQQLLEIEKLPSLQQLSLFALVQNITFESDFTDPDSLKDQLLRLRELFPNIESLKIDRSVTLESAQIQNPIAQDFDFSQLAGFKKLKSLQLPVTATGNYGFLNDMENLSELTLSQPLGGYDFEKSSTNIDNLISQIDANKAKQIKKLEIFSSPLDQDAFRRLCEKFDAVEDLNLTTVRTSQDYRDRTRFDHLVQDFEPLLLMRNLRKLSIDNLSILSNGSNLENLTEIRLRNPSNITFDNFRHTSKRFRNLENLQVTSSYENECDGEKKWHLIFEGISNLRNLSDLGLSRETHSHFRDIGGGIHSASSGGAGDAEINQEAVDYLSRTNLSKLFLDGFGSSKELYEELSAEYRRYDFNGEVLKLVAARREAYRSRPLIEASRSFIKNTSFSDSENEERNPENIVQVTEEYEEKGKNFKDMVKKQKERIEAREAGMNSIDSSDEEYGDIEAEVKEEQTFANRVNKTNEGREL